VNSASHVCTNRRKKCDQTRPVCERCIKGRYECLGYNEARDMRKDTRPRERSSINLEMRPILPRPAVGPSDVQEVMCSIDNKGHILIVAGNFRP
jgi:hypothetical protein